MPLSTDSIPNKPLNGAEILTYSLAVIRECAKKYDAKLFMVEFLYTMRNPALPKHELSVRHLQEETIQCPECKGDDANETCETCCLERRIPNTPSLALDAILNRARSLMDRDWVFGRNLVYPKVAYSFTLYFAVDAGGIAKHELSGMVENPNLVRVHYRMPFVQSEKVLPTEDKPMGGLIQHETLFDASQYPAPTAPRETDLTPDVPLRIVPAADSGAPRQRGRRAKTGA